MKSKLQIKKPSISRIKNPPKNVLIAKSNTVLKILKRNRYKNTSVASSYHSVDENEC